MPLTTILATDLVTNSRAVINDNFTYLDTKTSLAAATAGITVGVATGLVQINNGAAGKWAGLQVGSIALQSLATPTVPTITHGGTTGATTHGYKIVALLADGTTGTAASAETTNATGNATLDVTNYNIVTITAVTGATSYDIYRTTGGATQGKIGNSTGAAFNDTGLAASGAAPTVGGTGNLLWATDGVGNIGAVSNFRPKAGYFSDVLSAQNGIYPGGTAKSTLWSNADGQMLLSNVSGTGFTRINFGGVTSSFPALASGTLNGFAIQSAAGTSTFNDAVTAASGTVALRKIFDINTPTLTSTALTVTYTNTCTLYLGLPAASTNITFTNPAKSLLCDGPVDASKYYVGGVVGYNGSITLVGTLSIQVAYGIITGIT